MTTIWTEVNMKIVTIMKSCYLATVFVRYRFKLDTVIGINESKRISKILKINGGDRVSSIIIVWMWQHLLVTPFFIAVVLLFKLPFLVINFKILYRSALEI
jgi:hypothetical protein